MRKPLIIVAFILLALPVLAAVNLYEHFSYWLYTGESITIAWDAGTDADHYEFEVANVERSNSVFITGTTPQTQATVVIPKTGHWVFKARSVKVAAAGELYSDWISSDFKGDAMVNGQPQSWWIYAILAPVGGGLEIE